ncbi:hypothetical protein KP509_10G009300 [Ceratopteris richardii]|uniref:RING-type domain-containing protein n=2 Tax=Ceratopteris richardii TaxID=49495 RepID=A0A8T2TSQ5_CERRI|nr:hypothetical protein KP509_10G009300 [Ceratopteris richardii]KAH7426632.1 hypothetical protein KP509_10G009300 [Ceratopteris richardii]KAH7426633.1 hypothetical protein KP509_10G009300 [Ceratopteris richardii]KAH7426634.1 hypothetical protein KP509_10G009300 [Ceratopteris richardii]KAH7426635.1 hypothetical protein KP509_10G009300 [Ceratopteris richardii]
MTYNSVKIPKASLLTCLKCPLCSNLVHEATTISECLHTFCKDCIYRELDEEENDSCPICNVHLGCSPLEKLRPDRQLDDVCAKIFPAKPKKRKVIDEDADNDSPIPAKRKERSLSSLGIGVPPAANPGFVKRKTKSVTRRASTVISKETSTDIDSEGKHSDALKHEVNSESETPEKGCAHDTSSATQIDPHLEAEVHMKKEDLVDEDEVITNTKFSQKLDHLSSSRKSTSHVHEHSSGEEAGKRQSSSGQDNCKGSTVAVCKGQGPVQSDERKSANDEKHDSKDRKFPASFAVVRERTGKGAKKRSALAKLADIAVGQAVKERDPHMFHVPRAPRGRGALENPKTVATGEKPNEALQEKSSSPAVVAMPQGRAPQSLFKSSTAVEKLPTMGHISFQERESAPDTIAASSSKQNEHNAGFWFVLQAADNQNNVGAFPQLSSRYLRIKDGKLPLSVVKKYLVKKLQLNNEHEVEITCRGQPVVPSLPLESIRSIWFSTMPPLASMKEIYNAEPTSRRESYSTAEDFLMVLTYGRHRSPT